jgi:hypothetical protein
VFTWSETPITDIWNDLRYLKSSANVKNLLTGAIRSGRTIPGTEFTNVEERSHEIASCIRQGEEYFQAANSVSLSTAPLLLFYGTHVLAKAVILANKPGINLSQINFHGLNSNLSTISDPNVRDQLQHYVETTSEWQLEKEFGITHGGLFKYLCEIIENVNLSNGLVIKLKDLLRIIPDISDKYKRHYGESSHCFYLYGEPVYTAGKHEVSFPATLNVEEIKYVFPELENLYHLETRNTDFHFVSNEIIEPITFGHVQKGTIAGENFIRPLSCGLSNSVTVLFGALFIMSNVVRYKPAFWSKIIQGDETGSISIIEALCNTVKRRFPNDVLDLIWNERFEYGQPGHWV